MATRTAPALASVGVAVPFWDRWLRPPAVPAEVAAALTAAATEVRTGGQRLYIAPEAWQDEVWDFYDALEEFRYGVTWFAEAMSRVRLVAARQIPGQDEPEPVENGPAVDLMAELGGGVGGRAAMMTRFAQLLLIPGEGYLLGERAGREESWEVRSTNEIRARTGDLEVIDTDKSRPGREVWRRTAADRLLVRVWRPHAKLAYLADSPARAARKSMRELELANRKIQAQYLSRLASAGIVVFPEEITFPVRPEFQDAADPFVAEWIEIAREAIATPGTAAATVPIPMRVPGEYVDRVRFIDFTTKADEKELEKRDSAIRRLATALDLPAEILLGMGAANHWCVDEHTEILTERGWRAHADLEVGDVVLTLNHDTGLSQWQPVRDIYRAPVVDLPMVALERGNHSSLTTPNHRWPVLRPRKTAGLVRMAREFTHSENLDREHTIVTAAPCADLPLEPKYADDLVELVAWLWTEGNVRGRRVTIAQSHTRNLERVDRIRGCLTRLYGPSSRTTRGPEPRWRETVQPNLSSYGGPVTVFGLNRHAAAPLLDAAPGKRVRLEFVRSLTRAQLELFIDVSCQGDGWHYRSGRLDIWQRDHAALDAFELALILSGRMVTNTIHAAGRCVTPWKSAGVRPMKSVSGQHSLERRAYTGTVWCPVTDNSTWLARRNGTVYFTGNTAWQLDESAIKIHISPTAEIIAHCLTVGYLLPRLKARGVLAGDEVVWYDASELTLRPDRSENAIQVYDRNELSADALRRETGFDEADRPTTAELADQVLKFAARQPALTPGVLDKLTGEGIEVAGPEQAEPQEPDEDEPAADGPPDTEGEPPPAPVPRAAVLSAALVAEHRIEVEVGGGWRVIHPDGCRGSQLVCPVTWEAWRHPGFAPGTTGRYRLTLVGGHLAFGERVLTEANGHGVSGRVR